MSLSKKEIIKLCGDSYYPVYMANSRESEELHSHLFDNLVGCAINKTIFLSRYRKENAIIPAITNYISSKYNIESLLINSDIYKILEDNMYVIILKSNTDKQLPLDESLGLPTYNSYHAYTLSRVINYRKSLYLEKLKETLYRYSKKSKRDVLYLEFNDVTDEFLGDGMSLLISDHASVYNKIYISKCGIKFIIGVELPIEINGISIKKEHVKEIIPNNLPLSNKTLSYITSGGLSHRETTNFKTCGFSYRKFDASFGCISYQSGFGKYVHRGIEDIYNSGTTLENFKTYKGDINDI